MTRDDDRYGRDDRGGRSDRYQGGRDRDRGGYGGGGDYGKGGGGGYGGRGRDSGRGGGKGGGKGGARQRRSRSRDRRNDSESRSRSRRRRRRPGLWDVGPADGQAPPPMPQAHAALVRQGIQAPQNMAGASFGNKRAREVWVGNLLQGAVAPQHLKDFFTQMFNALPSFQEKYAELVKEGKSPVRDIQMTNNAAYAFVEFWTEELAATAVEFNQVEFMGRPMKTGRPTGFVIVGPQPIPLDCSSLRQAGLLPGAGGGGMGGGGALMITGGNVENPIQNKKQRELYFGNLPQGQLTADSMRHLVTPACELLPEYNASLGAPIVSLNMSGEGKFCFIEFQNDRLATAALPIFNGMEIFGRKMTVARPTGYVDPMGGGVVGGGMAPNMAPLASLNPALAALPMMGEMYGR